MMVYVALLQLVQTSLAETLLPDGRLRLDTEVRMLLRVRGRPVTRSRVVSSCVTQ